MIILENISKTYKIGNQIIHAVNGVNLKIEHGEMISIMGASGSGKTTTMNIIGLLDRPTSGKYILNNNEVSQLSRNELARLRNRTIGFIFQQFYLLPRWSALQNVMLPLMYRGLSVAEMKRLAIEALEKVAMKDFIEHKPTELSGGQQQRVAIARALVTTPRIILADEPTGALDSKTGQRVIDILRDINTNEGTTVIVVTHDVSVAKQSKRIIKISDGRIVI